MMTSRNSTSLFPGIAGPEYSEIYNDTHTWSPNNDSHQNCSENMCGESVMNSSSYDPKDTFSIYLELLFISIFIIMFCLFGLVGNGAVIWFLGFRIKRDPFTTYILNLAVADFGVLISVFHITILMVTYFMEESSLQMVVQKVFAELFLFMYSTSQFLLTAISVDRCVAIFCPIWHRCHRPPHLSAAVSALMWILSFLLTVVIFIFTINGRSGDLYYIYQFLMNAVLCFPLITISTLTLFIKICFKSQQSQRRKLLRAILMALLFFLILAFPLNIIFMADYFYYTTYMMMIYYGLLGACLNSSVNPLIYFLVGRKNTARSRGGPAFILQRVFKEEEDGGEDEEPPLQTHL